MKILILWKSGYYPGRSTGLPTLLIGALSQGFVTWRAVDAYLLQYWSVGPEKEAYTCKHVFKLLWLKATCIELNLQKNFWKFFWWRISIIFFFFFFIWSAYFHWDSLTFLRSLKNWEMTRSSLLWLQTDTFFCLFVLFFISDFDYYF